MKTYLFRRWDLKVVLAPVVLLFVLFAGCSEDYDALLCWSPDGAHLAVISRDGLHLCDADGKLSPIFVPDVYRMAWLSDSQNLVLARKRHLKDWAEIAKVVGRERSEAIVAAAETFWQKAKNKQVAPGKSGFAGRFDDSDLPETDYMAVLAYLFEHHRPEELGVLSEKDSEEWKEMGKIGALSELITARIDDEKITIGKLLWGHLIEKWMFSPPSIAVIKEIRVSPNDKAVAFVAEVKEDDPQLLLAQVNVPGATVVADYVAFFPDWTPDSRSLVYIQAANGGAKSNLQLGALVQREVLDQAGKIDLKAELKEMAGWVFSDHGRVRCLRDGRVLFNAIELNLPVAAADLGAQREQLFALDLTKQSTLVRMIPRSREQIVPDVLCDFEVSPDENQVIFGEGRSGFPVLTLATGEIKEVVAGKNYYFKGGAVWRKSGEITYVRGGNDKAREKPSRKGDLVLRDGEKEKSLSDGWPDVSLNDWLFYEDKKHASADSKVESIPSDK